MGHVTIAVPTPDEIRTPGYPRVEIDGESYVGLRDGVIRRTWPAARVAAIIAQCRAAEVAAAKAVNAQEATRRLSATDHWALKAAEGIPMTDAQKAYRAALRVIVNDPPLDVDWPAVPPPEQKT